MKKCNMCNENEVNGLEKYCSDCRKIRKRVASKKNSDGKGKVKTIAKRKELDDNFYSLNLTGLDLLPNNFTSKSGLSHFSYQNHFKIKWIDILKYYGKVESLMDALLNEYKLHYESTGSRDLKLFSEGIGSSQVFFDSLNHSLFRDCIGVRKMRNDDEDYELNFNRVRDTLGYIPLYTEFEELSEINVTTYANKFNLSGIVYDTIIRMYSTEEEFLTYKARQQKHKTQAGRNSHQGNKYTEEDLEQEFKRVFDENIKLTGKNPARRVFNSLSAIDDSVYRHRFNIPFGEIVEHYGYTFDATNNKSEKLVIETIGNILNESPIPQKTFDWLLSTKNYRLRCDGYYLSNKLVVEFDGRQHTEVIPEWGGEEVFMNIQANDRIKDTLIPQHGLTLIRISCYDPFWDEDFLLMRLFEHGIMPPNHTLISDSQSQQSKIA